MVDPLSITAGAVGVVAFTQSLVQSALKIRVFCKDLKDVPIQLQETLDQIDGLGKVMCRLGNEVLREPASDVDAKMLMTSLQVCQNAAGRASAIVLELQDTIKRRRRWGAVKTVMRRPDMMATMSRLDRCKADLHLAYTIFVDWQRAKALENLQQQLEDSTFVCRRCRKDSTTMTQKSAVKTDNSISGRRRCGSQQHGKAVTICIRPPFWLCQYAVDWSFTMESGQWTTTLKFYRSLPFDHSVYRICRAGDTQHVFRLLEERKVSLTDRFVDLFQKSHSLFSMAAEFEQTELARFLLDHGSDAEWTPDMSYNTGYGRLNAFAGAIDYDALVESQSHGRFLLDESEFSDSRARVFLEVGNKPFSSWTYEERLMMLAGIADQRYPDLFLSMLENDEVEPQLFTVRDPIWNLTFLHLVARAWSRPDWAIPRYKSRLMHLLHKLVVLGVRHSADFHAERQSLTPLMTLIANLDRRSTQDRISARQTVQLWVDTLSTAGIDLQDYGAHESRVFTSDLVTNSANIFERLDVISFDYGPSAEDWKIWYRHPGDVFAGVFWQTIEYPLRTIPGAWMEFNTQCSWYDEPASPGMRTEYYRVRVKRKTIRKLKGEVKTAKRFGRDLPFHQHDFVEFISFVNQRARLWRNHGSVAVFNTEDECLEHQMYAAGVAIGLY